MRLRDLREGRDAPLYHFMNDDKAIHVFSTDTIPARWEHDTEQMGPVKGNSFSRNSRFDFGGAYYVRLTVDQTLLAHRHRILPLDADWTLNRSIKARLRLRTRLLSRQGHSDFAEEFVVGDITNLHTYLTKIEIRKPSQHNIDRKFYLLCQDISRYSKKFKIPLTIDPYVIKGLKEMLRRWRDDD